MTITLVAAALVLLTSATAWAQPPGLPHEGGLWTSPQHWVGIGAGLFAVAVLVTGLLLRYYYRPGAAGRRGNACPPGERPEHHEPHASMLSAIGLLVAVLTGLLRLRPIRVRSLRQASLRSIQSPG